MQSLRDFPGGPVVRTGLGAFTAGGMGSIPGRGTKIPQATWRGQKKKKKERKKEMQSPRLKNEGSKGQQTGPGSLGCHHFAVQPGASGLTLLKPRFLGWGQNSRTNPDGLL